MATDRRTIDDFLALKRIAVVGVSRNSKDFTRSLFRELRKRGYDAVPVNPAVTEVDGIPCAPNLAAVMPPPEGALLLTKPQVTEKAVRECAAARVSMVWMYRAGGAGAVSQQAAEFCRSEGIRAVEGECPFMFFPNTGFLPHGLHGCIRKLTGSYPK
jgi:predicted CoA-binding protein